MANKNVIIIGAGGHSKVIADIILKNNDNLLGFLDDDKDIGTKIIKNYSVIGNFNYINKQAGVSKENCIKIQKFEREEEVQYIIGIGDNRRRKEISEEYNLNYYTAIHPSAEIAIDVREKIQEGTVIMANAVINSSAEIGKHVIINTSAVIEHDNIVEDFVHISPNATLGGTVTIGTGTHVGISATVRNNINITSDSKIGAGAVVVKNIEKKGTYIGVPAKLI